MQRLLKPLVFTLCLIPALVLSYQVWLAFQGLANTLGPDPAKALALETGEWSIRMLVLALAITPLRYLFNQPLFWKFRRMVGLYALFYVCLHFLVFLIFLLGMQWSALSEEIVERPYITVGFLALVLLLPLGLTSMNWAQRKLGRRWKQLHRLVYVINILAVIHIIWIVRSSFADALIYGALVFLLLFYRVLRKVNPAVRKFTLRQSQKKVS